MSAICGIVHFDGKPVDASDLEIMVESSPFRGKHGTRVHLDGNAGFAHMAFHVTPESVNEKQPLVSDDGRLVLQQQAVIGDHLVPGPLESQRQGRLAPPRRAGKCDDAPVFQAYRAGVHDLPALMTCRARQHLVHQ